VSPDAVGPIAEALGMDARHARLLRAHNSGIYLPPQEQAVIGTAAATDENGPGPMLPSR
jgi:hypothetical protein